MFKSRKAALCILLGTFVIVIALMLLYNNHETVKSAIHSSVKKALRLNSGSWQFSLNFEKHDCSRSVNRAELASLLKATTRLNKTCTGYYELRDVNFLHPTLAQRLCKGHPAYKLVGNKFPACEMCGTLPSQLVNSLNKTATKTYITSALTKKPVTIYTYPLGDAVSESVIRWHGWEQGQVALTLSIAKKFPAGSVTFLDIGCNIGVYALQAREAGISTVAVDANLRNVLRVRMSANAMGWPADSRFRLLWMYFHKAVSLQYISFNTNWCNVGAAAFRNNSMTDTIPVMSGTADDVLASIGTKLVVIKIDIESSEYSFLSTGLKLFQEKDVVAVQMEWWRADISKPPSESPDFHQIIDFFRKRNYAMFPMGNLNHELSVKKFTDWDVIWIRRDYLKTVRGH